MVLLTTFALLLTTFWLLLMLLIMVAAAAAAAAAVIVLAAAGGEIDAPTAAGCCGCCSLLDGNWDSSARDTDLAKYSTSRRPTTESRPGNDSRKLHASLAQ